MVSKLISPIAKGVCKYAEARVKDQEVHAVYYSNVRPRGARSAHLTFDSKEAEQVRGILRSFHGYITHLTRSSRQIAFGVCVMCSSESVVSQLMVSCRDTYLGNNRRWCSIPRADAGFKKKVLKTSDLFSLPVKSKLWRRTKVRAKMRYLKRWA